MWPSVNLQLNWKKEVATCLKYMTLVVQGDDRSDLPTEQSLTSPLGMSKWVKGFSGHLAILGVQSVTVGAANVMSRALFLVVVATL